jgi:hypothetical protein
VNQSRHSTNHEPTFAQLAADTVSVLWVRLRIWIANRLLDLGLIEAAKWVAPER